MGMEQPTENKAENNIENVDISKLSFKQLQEARELGEKSLKRTKRGFIMVDGKELYFKDMNGYSLMNYSSMDGLEHYMATHDSILNDSRNKDMDEEVLIQELERVLVSEEFGYRIIE